MHIPIKSFWEFKLPRDQCRAASILKGKCYFCHKLTYIDKSHYRTAQLKGKENELNFQLESHRIYICLFLNLSVYFVHRVHILFSKKKTF